MKFYATKRVSSKFPAKLRFLLGYYNNQFKLIIHGIKQSSCVYFIIVYTDKLMQNSYSLLVSLTKEPSIVSLMLITRKIAEAGT